MPERYVDAILKYLAGREYRPVSPEKLARHMGIGEGDFGTFRQAVKQLRSAGRIVLGDRDALTLPAVGKTVVGFFRANAKGFGFIVPETPNANGDLYVPPEGTGGAMTGDQVIANVRKRGKRDGETLFAGEVVKIVKRGQNRFVGTLDRTGEAWFVLPDGTRITTPIVVRDIAADGPAQGDKVVVEIVQYPEAGKLPIGVIVETLGEKGTLAVETEAVIRAHGLRYEFPPAALAEARQAVDTFDPAQSAGREDLTELTIITIDPPSAKDFDDAISLTRDGDGKVTLGIHIADVSHFVVEGGALDAEAKERTTSAYFPRKVVPMLPEILSNGVCSLQQGEPRFAKSVFITYDAKANVTAHRYAESVIRSTRRLTYAQAQQICDGKTDDDGQVNELLLGLQDLARRIEKRRRQAGMLHLDLPEVELVFDDAHQIAGVEPTDDSYTHTMIEMFMVEANEAVSILLTRLEREHLRRIHPQPDPQREKQLVTFVRACGHRIPRDMTRADMQALLDAVRDKPESYAVNLALLKTFQQAEYSPMQIGHFALASEHYCHFTSPIRRYPDLTVHRMLAEHCRGTLDARPPEDVAALVQLGEDCTAGEKRAEAAEAELRQVLLLQLLADRVGESFRGVVTGVTNFGIFVQSPKYLIEGLVRLEDLGDDWWEVSARYGHVRGERSGKTYRIGDVLEVRIAAVDIAKRQLNLTPLKADKKAGKVKKAGKAKNARKSKKPTARKKSRPGKNARKRKR